MPCLIGIHCTVSNCMDQPAMNWIVTNTLIGAMGEKKWVDPILLCCDLSPNLPLVISTNLTAKKQDVRAVCKKDLQMFFVSF